MAGELGINPKDAIGFKKVNLFLLPPAAAAHAAHAMMDGAKKYGPYNWRDKKVIASVYVAACLRHIACWQEKEERAKDSGVHHLGHAIACLAILLDCQETGNLIDDRVDGGKVPEILDRISREVMDQSWADAANVDFKR